MFFTLVVPLVLFCSVLLFLLFSGLWPHQNHLGYILLRSWLICLTQPTHTTILHRTKWLERRIHLKRKNWKQYSLPQSYRFWISIHVRNSIQKYNYKVNGGSGKKKTIKDSRDLVTAELRSNQAEIKNKLNEMQSKLDVLTVRVNEVEENVSDIEDKLIVRKEAEEKREKQKIMRKS